MSKRITAESAIMIGSVVMGTLQSLSNTPSWREHTFSKALQQANRVGVILNSKKEALMQSFDNAYTKLATKHNLERVNFQNLSSSGMSKALSAFEKYGETELLNKYEALNKEMSDYLTKYQTTIDKNISQLTGGKVYSLSSLAKQHNDKIDEMVSKIQNDAIKHNSDVKDKLNVQREKDQIQLNEAKDKYKHQLTDKIQKAEFDLNEKQGNESNKLQQQKFDKYSTLAKATEAANQWIDRIEKGSAQHATKWYDHLIDFRGKVDKFFGGTDFVGEMERHDINNKANASKQEREDIKNGIDVDIEFKI